MKSCPSRRILLALTMALVFVAASAKRAEACFFGCTYHFGFFNVADGELVYYNGCYSYIDDVGHTHIVCVYSSALN